MIASSILSHFLCLVHGERDGSSINAAQVVGEGNASLTLTKLVVGDEGTYICTVSLGPFHSQQVVQLRIIRKFHPDLSPRPQHVFVYILLILLL